MSPSGATLWNLYLSGLIRNINSILAGVYGDGLEVPDANRTRGERSDDILRHLLQNEELVGVVHRLISPESKNAKQRSASLHDLALAHVLFCTAASLKMESALRSSSAITSSMLLGEVVARLREGYQQLAIAFPDCLISSLSDDDLAGGLGKLYISIEESLADAVAREGRAKQLADLAPSLSVRFLLTVFTWMVENGLDDRPFEDFILGAMR